MVDIQSRLRQPAETITRPFRKFLAWWIRELRACVPGEIIERFSQKHRTLFVAVDREQCKLSLREGDGPATRLLGGFGNVEAVDDIEKTVVELRPGAALRRMAYLPADAEDRLSDVLGFELDRLTPFRPEQVYFDYRVTDRRTRRGFIGVELVAVPRPLVDRIVKDAASAGLEVSVVRFLDPHESAARSWPEQNMLPHSPGSAANRPARSSAVLAVIAALLGLAVVALPLLVQQRGIAALNEHLQTIEPAALEADGIRAEIQAAASRSRFFYDKRVAAPMKVLIIDELTQVIPDDTWLARLEISGLTVRIHGESANASELISLIEESDYLKAAEFASPVTKNPRNALDRFVIESKIEIWEDE